MPIQLLISWMKRQLLQNRDSNGHVKEELTALDRALMDGKWKSCQLLEVEAAPIVYKKKEVTDQDVLVT